MTEREFEAISRLSAWMRDFGKEKTPVFIADLELVLNMAKRNDIEELLLSDGFLTKFAAAFGNTPIPGISSTECGIRPWCTETGQNACSCHERDGSYVCDYCYAQGRRGHMETLS